MNSSFKLSNSLNSSLNKNLQPNLSSTFSLNSPSSLNSSFGSKLTSSLKTNSKQTSQTKQDSKSKTERNKSLKNRYHFCKNALIEFLDLFSENFEYYVDTFTFEKFQQNDNKSAADNLKRCETVFDKNYETLIRNKKMIDDEKDIHDMVYEFTQSIEEIINEIEKDNDEIIEYNNKLIDTMKEFEEKVRVEKTEKRFMLNRTFKMIYQYNMDNSYDQYQFESIIAKRKREEEEELERIREEERKQLELSARKRIEEENRRFLEQKEQLEKEREIQERHKRKQQEMSTFLEDRKRITRRMKDHSFFPIAKSSLTFLKLNDILVSTNEYLVFENNGEPLPVGEEIHDSFCVGTMTKSMIVVDFTTGYETDKYSVRFDPQIITLKNEEAIEVKMYVKTLCNCVISDKICINVYEAEKGEIHEAEIPFSFKTIDSTKLNPDHIKTERKLSENSTCQIFQGTYRNQFVNIKKLNNLNPNLPKDKQKIDEFKREMEITEHCQHDFISQFIGSVIIPGKLTIVTETSQYLSVGDLMKNMPDSPSSDIRLKFILDASQGLKYLHSQLIMHRNVKPFHLLVTSLDTNATVNVKLSGFGTARKYDIEAIHPVYSKNIGTPAYMSPEMFSHKEYGLQTDIYSFAITMLEIITWLDAFPQDKFAFPWDISDFVTSGKRPEIINQVTNQELKELIQICWRQETHERINMNDVVERLLKIYQFQQTISH